MDASLLDQIAGRFDVKLYGNYYYEKVKALRLRGRLYRDVKVEDRAVMRAMQLSKRRKQQQPQRVNFDLIDLHSEDDDDEDENIVVQIDDQCMEQHTENGVKHGDENEEKQRDIVSDVRLMDSPDASHDHRIPDDVNNQNINANNQETMSQIEDVDAPNTTSTGMELSHPLPPARHLLGSEHPAGTNDSITGTETHAVAVNSITGDHPNTHNSSSRKLKKSAKGDEDEDEDEIKVDNDYDYVERDLKWFRRLTCGMVVATSWTDKRLYQDVLVAAMTAQTLAAQTIR